MKFNKKKINNNCNSNKMIKKIECFLIELNKNPYESTYKLA